MRSWGEVQAGYLLPPLLGREFPLFVVLHASGRTTTDVPLPIMGVRAGPYAFGTWYPAEAQSDSHARPEFNGVRRNGSSRGPVPIWLGVVGTLSL